MIHLKFSLTSQCHKTTVVRVLFKNKKANWPGIIQCPVSAG